MNVVVNCVNCMNLYMTSWCESSKLADVLPTDPESDDDSILINPLSHSLHTPSTSRSLCSELSSTIVCTFSSARITVFSVMSVDLRA